VLERKFLPLLDMFVAEGTHFADLQRMCLSAAREKREMGEEYKGKVKVNNRDLEEFTSDFKEVEEDLVRSHN